MRDSAARDGAALGSTFGYLPETRRDLATPAPPAGSIEIVTRASALDYSDSWSGPGSFALGHDHAAAGNGQGVSQSNLVTGGFSCATFNQAVQRMLLLVDDENEPIGVPLCKAQDGSACWRYSSWWCMVSTWCSPRCRS